jgi:hypothetical protein
MPFGNKYIIGVPVFSLPTGYVQKNNQILDVLYGTHSLCLSILYDQDKQCDCTKFLRAATKDENTVEWQRLRAHPHGTLTLLYLGQCGWTGKRNMQCMLIFAWAMSLGGEICSAPWVVMYMCVLYVSA